MCMRFLFLLITRLAAGLRLSRREEAWKNAEILVLRHQLTVLQRHQPCRPKLTRADRAMLATLISVIPKARCQGLRLLVTPDTILRWHRDIVRRRWAARSMRGKTGRPATRRNIRALAAAAPPFRPASCRPVAVAGLRRPARRSRCPRRAQRACPAHHLRTLHTRLRPDRQPAHRASPPPQPAAPRWPTKSGADARNPVRHASVPQLDPAGQLDPVPPPRSDYTPVNCVNTDLRSLAHGSRPPQGAVPGTRSPYAADQPRSGPPLAHSNRERSTEPPRTRCRPGLRKYRRRA